MSKEDGTQEERLDEDRKSSEFAVFSEYETASRCIGLLTKQTAYLDESDEALVRLRTIFDKYLELPSLLDQHFETMVIELSSAARVFMEDSDMLKERFWETPLPRILSALYALSKVRGRKRVQRFLPHEVKDVEAVLQTLQVLDKLYSSSDVNSSSNGGPQLWESVYVLWNWMGILSLVPFDCWVVVDGAHITLLIQLAKKYLSEAGPTREMAASCLGSWLSRPDLEQTEFEHFKEWSSDVLKEFVSKSTDPRREVFRCMGVLQTLVTIIKVSTAERTTLINFVYPLLPTTLELSQSNPSNLLLRKYLIKWWTRMGTVYLPPRMAAWRYQRGRRSLNENLVEQTQDITKREGPSVNGEESKSQSESQDDFFLVPAEVEEAVGSVIAGLADPSSTVRWSAAKGIGRITERLPAICADDVLDGILELFDDAEKDSDWHGACLALAELARRGLLLPRRLGEVVPRIVEAIHVRSKDKSSPYSLQVSP